MKKLLLFGGICCISACATHKAKKDSAPPGVNPDFDFNKVTSDMKFNVSYNAKTGQYNLLTSDGTILVADIKAHSKSYIESVLKLRQHGVDIKIDLDMLFHHALNRVDEIVAIDALKNLSPSAFRSKLEFNENDYSYSWRAGLDGFAIMGGELNTRDQMVDSVKKLLFNKIHCFANEVRIRKYNGKWEVRFEKIVERRTCDGTFIKESYLGLSIDLSDDEFGDWLNFDVIDDVYISDGKLLVHTDTGFTLDFSFFTKSDIIDCSKLLQKYWIKKGMNSQHDITLWRLNDNNIFLEDHNSETHINLNIKPEDLKDKDLYSALEFLHDNKFFSFE